MPHQVRLGIPVQQQQRRAGAADACVDHPRLGLELAAGESVEHQFVPQRNGPAEQERHRVGRGEPRGGGVRGRLGGDPLEREPGRRAGDDRVAGAGAERPHVWIGDRQRRADGPNVAGRAVVDDVDQRQRRHSCDVGQRLHGDQPSGDGGGRERVDHDRVPARGPWRARNARPSARRTRSPARAGAPGARERARARPDRPRRPPAARLDPRPRARAPARRRRRPRAGPGARGRRGARSAATSCSRTPGATGRPDRRRRRPCRPGAAAGRMGARGRARRRARRTWRASAAGLGGGTSRIGCHADRPMTVDECRYGAAFNPCSPNRG